MVVISATDSNLIYFKIYFTRAHIKKNFLGDIFLLAKVIQMSIFPNMKMFAMLTVHVSSSNTGIAKPMLIMMIIIMDSYHGFMNAGIIQLTITVICRLIWCFVRIKEMNTFMVKRSTICKQPLAILCIL